MKALIKTDLTPFLRRWKWIIKNDKAITNDGLIKKSANYSELVSGKRRIDSMKAMNIDKNECLK